MRLGRRARYSVRLMMGIATLTRKGRPVSTKEIAATSGISRRYLEQISSALKNAALIKGHCGRGGGYTLARPAARIKIGEIIGAVTGPVHIAECAADPESCIHTDYCTCRLFWRLLDQQLNAVFNNFTLADLIEDEGTLKLKGALAALDEQPQVSLDRPSPWFPKDNDCPRSNP